MQNNTNQIFIDIKDTCPHKKTQSLCNKLLRKCSFNSGKDIENLCHLAYHLYVYGQEDIALKVSAYTHDTPFPGKGGYRVWDFILYIWGLEVFILKNRGQDIEASKRILAMDAIWMTHIPGSAFPPEKHMQFEIARRGRFTYPEILHSEDIADASSVRSANEWRFCALFKMIGYGSTNLFPDLVKHWDPLEEHICSYISVLKDTY